MVDLSPPDALVPYKASLVAWGRNERGGWWGLVTWQHTIRDPGSHSQVIGVAAWVPAGWLKKPPHSASATTPRHRLDDNHLSWPSVELLPPWNLWYAGVWADGPLPLPDGHETAHPDLVERYETST